MSKEDLTAKDFVSHIIEAADRILRYTEGMNRDEFFADSLKQDAVIRNVEIIGEAANNFLALTRALPPGTHQLRSLRFTVCGTVLRTVTLR